MYQTLYILQGTRVVPMANLKMYSNNPMYCTLCPTWTSSDPYWIVIVLCPPWTGSDPLLHTYCTVATFGRFWPLLDIYCDLYTLGSFWPSWILIVHTLPTLDRFWPFIRYLLYGLCPPWRGSQCTGLGRCPASRWAWTGACGCWWGQLCPAHLPPCAHAVYSVQNRPQAWFIYVSV